MVAVLVRSAILITHSMNQVPFDLTNLGCIVYEYTHGAMQLWSTIQESRVSTCWPDEFGTSTLYIGNRVGTALFPRDGHTYEYEH